MLNVSVINFEKKKVGDIDLPEDVFKAEIKAHLMQTVVRWQLACRRAGTVATKTKGLVRGGGKKPFKQKGTGEARQGSSRSPLMPGGGTAFGPQPRDYSYTLPKQVKKAGLKVALSYLVSNEKLWVMDEIVSDGKTKQISASLKKLGIKKALLVDDIANVSLKRATLNLKKFKFVPVQGVNVFDLLKYDGCVVSKAALSLLVERLGENNVN